MNCDLRKLFIWNYSLGVPLPKIEIKDEMFLGHAFVAAATAAAGQPEHRQQLEHSSLYRSVRPPPHSTSPASSQVEGDDAAPSAEL